MTAVVHDRYGPPEVLRIEEVEQPVPKDDEVLVKVPRDDGQPDGLSHAPSEAVLLAFHARAPQAERMTIGLEFAAKSRLSGRL